MAKSAAQKKQEKLEKEELKEEAKKIGDQIWQKNKKDLSDVIKIKLNASPISSIEKDENLAVKQFAKVAKTIKDNTKVGPLIKRLRECDNILGLAKQSATIRKIYERKLPIFKMLGQTENAIETIRYLLEDDLQGKHIVEHLKRSELPTTNITTPFSRFGLNEKYSEFVPGMELASFANYGRGIIANRQFKVGEKIFHSKAYAWAAENARATTKANTAKDKKTETATKSRKMSATESSKRDRGLPYCLTCGKIKTAFIPCPRCPNVLFCSVYCQQTNKLHKYECGTTFHTDAEIDMFQKCAVNTILEGIEAFDGNIDQMREETIRFIDTKRNEVPPQCVTAKDRYFCTLALTHKYPNKFDEEIQQIFDIMMGLKDIKMKFGTKNKKLFLQHLIAHSVAVQTANGFVGTLGGERAIAMLYDSVSFLNHSCSPNVGISTNGNLLILLVLKSFSDNVITI